VVSTKGKKLGDNTTIQREKIHTYDEFEDQIRAMVIASKVAFFTITNVQATTTITIGSDTFSKPYKGQY